MRQTFSPNRGVVFGVFIVEFYRFPMFHGLDILACYLLIGLVKILYEIIKSTLEGHGKDHPYLAIFAETPS